MKKVLIIAEDAKSLVLTRKELIEAILEKDCKCDVLVPKDQHCKTLVEMGCSIIDISFQRRSVNPCNEFVLLLKYISHLGRNKYDFAITYSIKPNLYGGLACSIFKIPYYINVTGMGSALNGDGIVKFLVKGLYRCVAPRAAGVFFENIGNRDAFIKWRLCRKDNSYVFHGAGINLSQFSYSPRKKTSNKISILYIGRLMKEKGIVELCNTAKKIRNNYSNVEFNLVGDFEGDFEDLFRREYINIPNIHYLGYRDDIKECIKECDCVILPSYHEGMANVLLEGGAIGRPLLASNICGCKEAIISGKNGYVFNPRDEDSLYAALKKFILLNENEKMTFGEESRKHIEKYFDRNVVVEQILQIVFK